MGDKCKVCKERLPCQECGRVPAPFGWQAIPAPAGLQAYCQWEKDGDLECFPVVAIAIATNINTRLPLDEYNIEQTLYLLAGLQTHDSWGWTPTQYIVGLTFEGNEDQL